MVYLSDEVERQEFAVKAAKHLAEHPEISTFSEKNPEPGCWFACRWGMGEDSVIVFKLDDAEPVINYQNLITQYEDNGK